jgi:hypothetical protein
MLKLALAVAFMAAQLSGPGGGLPQILRPDFKPATALQAGKRGDVIVSFTLKLTPVPGITLVQSDLAASEKDPKAKDQYYVDLPTIKFALTAAKAGKYEVPGKLKYFFCNKADGFCSFQVVDVKIPLNVN